MWKHVTLLFWGEIESPGEQQGNALCLLYKNWNCSLRLFIGNKDKQYRTAYTILVKNSCVCLAVVCIFVFEVGSCCGSAVSACVGRKWIRVFRVKDVAQR